MHLGKTVEEALRYALENNVQNISVQTIQDYANDLYFISTNKLSKKIVEEKARPINALVRKGIRVLNRISAQKLIPISDFKITYNDKLISVFPDFQISELKLGQKLYKDTCLELKVTSNFSNKIKYQHARQCVDYVKNQKPVFLLYLIYKDNQITNPIFDIETKLFLINRKN